MNSLRSLGEFHLNVAIVWEQSKTAHCARDFQPRCVAAPSDVVAGRHFGVMLGHLGGANDVELQVCLMAVRLND
jgi:hypothetical protein